MSDRLFGELWRLEERFWLGSAGFYEEALAAQALMVLPSPAGVLDRAATIEAIRSAPRWRKVAFRQRFHAQPGEGTAVLAYVAEADRGETGSSYVAQCSSTYVRDGGRWLLALHQQAAGDPSASRDRDGRTRSAGGEASDRQQGE
jgi:hypothetical protein